MSRAFFSTSFARLAAVLALAGAVSGCHRSAGRGAGRRSELLPATPLDLSHAGRIYGQVDYVGTPPALPPLDLRADPYCASQHQGALPDPSLVINANHTLRGALVYIARGLENHRFRPPAWPVELKQTGCMFKPHVAGIMAGQPLVVSSADATPHNVHFLGPAGANWNLALLPQSPPLSRRFPPSAVGPAPVEVVCNVHPWMRAWVAVRPNPYFAVTGRRGRYRFPPLPPGAYTVAVWQERLGIEQHPVKLVPGGRVELVFQFGKAAAAKRGGL